MFRPSSRRSTLLFLLALVLLAVPWPAEAGTGAGTAWFQPWDLAARLWETFVGLWNQNGCSVDPSGTCGTGSQANNGCSLDPDGRCAGSPAGSTVDNGCSVDPNGGCRE
jgi:hypothetical protein